LERAKGDVGDCFLDDEDDEDDNGLRGEGEVRKSDWAVQGVEIGDHREEEEDVGKSEEKLERVVRRVTAVLDILSVGKLSLFYTFRIRQSPQLVLIWRFQLSTTQHSHVTTPVNRQ
jgi:hypothetical protein